MHSDVQDFVHPVCLANKQNTYQSLLQGPIAPPTSIWEDITMDFIVRVPTHQGQTVILAIIDRFSKTSHCGTLPTHFTACQNRYVVHIDNLQVTWTPQKYHLSS